MTEHCYTPGIVYLVGAGPGDPELITVRGLKILQSATAIVYDNLASEKLLSFADSKAEVIYAGKEADKHAMTQEQLNELLAAKAAAGHTVCRLKGGDPFLFGRGGEEALYLAERGVRFEVVPGVTAAIAVPAFAGIPVTHRAMSSSAMIVTGHEDPTKESSAIQWNVIAKDKGTLVLLMGVKNLGKIAAELIRHGKPKDTPAAVIRYGSLPIQRTVTGTLDNIVEKAARAGITAPAILVVGKVVNLRGRLNWYERKPLFGKRIVVTRAKTQASELSVRLIDLGAEVIELPTIRLVSPDDPEPLLRSIRNIAAYDWIVFSSANGVSAFLSALAQEHLDVRALGGIRLCAIGPATADRLRAAGLIADVVPQERFVAEAAVEALAAHSYLKGKKILIARAQEARDALPDGLSARGAKVDVVASYKTVREDPPENVLDGLLRNGPVDVVTFTSSSTVTNFVRLVGKSRLNKLKKRARFASIGPITSETMRANALPVSMEAERFTIPGLVEAICRFMAAHSKQKGG